MAQRKARTPAPPEALVELERALESEGLARGYILRGDERYFQERALTLLRARADQRGDEVCSHDGTRGSGDFSVSRVIDDLSGGGLFAERRFVVLRNGDASLKKIEGGKSSLTQAVEAFAAADGNPGTLVLMGGSLRADNAAVKALRKAGGTMLDLRKLWDSPPQWNPDPRSTELVQWLVVRGRELGVRLDPAQAVYICAATGNDLFALDAHLERLRSLPGEELAKVVGWGAGQTPWAVGDLFLAGDPRRAAAGLETLFSGGFQEKSGKRLVDKIALANMLQGALSRGVRQALAIAVEVERGVSPKEVASAVGVHGRAVDSALERARAHPVATWRRRLEDVLDLERRSKSGSSVDANDFARLLLRWHRRSKVRT